MPGYITYAENTVRCLWRTNVPFASGVMYEQYARNVEAPVLNYKVSAEVSWSTCIYFKEVFNIYLSSYLNICVYSMNRLSVHA